jgi:hypothetical protein
MSRPLRFTTPGSLPLTRINDWICLISSNETQTDPLPKTTKHLTGAQRENYTRTIDLFQENRYSISDGLER